MALPSFLKRKTPAAPPPSDEAIVQRARTSARRRLIGAAVLLAVGVIAFPLLFETQPRPIPVDIPIEIPRKEGQPALVPPPKLARVVTGQVGDAASRAVAEPPSSPGSATTPVPVSAPPAPAASVTAAPAVQAPPSAAVASAKPPASVPAPAKEVKEVKEVKETKETKPAVTASAPAAKPAPEPAVAAGRFVVQVGAFGEVTAAREVRLKVEKLGLKTYTQVVETPQGKRIRVRVGPFESQDEAAKVLAKLKAAKLPGAVLTL